MITTRVSELTCLSAEYPLLQIRHEYGLVVLFTSDSTGVCICPGSTAHSLGETRDDWKEVKFNLYRGEITLKNS